MKSPKSSSIIGESGLYLITGIAAVLGVMMIDPFIGLSDGFSRWKLAHEICESG